jgi:hypothetical protein
LKKSRNFLKNIDFFQAHFLQKTTSFFKKTTTARATLRCFSATNAPFAPTSKEGVRFAHSMLDREGVSPFQTIPLHYKPKPCNLGSERQHFLVSKKTVFQKGDLTMRVLTNGKGALSDLRDCLKTPVSV